MLAVATWTVVLAAGLLAVGLATLLAVALGRASSRADAEEERLIAERRLEASEHEADREQHHASGASLQG